MKKFSFSLEALLTVREWEIQRAQQRLGEANLKVAEIERKLEDARAGKDRLFAEWKSVSGGRFSAQDRISMTSSVAGVERQLAELQKALQGALQQRQQAMESVTVATRGKKVVQNLKERRLEEHTAEAYRQEAAEIEDIFNAKRSKS